MLTTFAFIVLLNKTTTAMRELDVKHLAYHVLVGLYFIWLPVFIILIGLAINSSVYMGNMQLSKIILLWIFLNLVIGTSLYAVIRLFDWRRRLGRVITYSYYAMAVACITTIMIVLN